MGGKKKTKWRKLPPEELSHITIKRRDEERIKTSKQNESMQEKTKEKQESSETLFNNEMIEHSDTDEGNGYFENGVWVPISQNTATTNLVSPDRFYTVPTLMHPAVPVIPALCSKYHTFHSVNNPFSTNYFIPNNNHYFCYFMGLQTKIADAQSEEPFQLHQDSTDGCAYGESSVKLNDDENEDIISENMNPLPNNVTDVEEINTAPIGDDKNNQIYTPNWLFDQSEMTYQYPEYGFSQPFHNVPVYIFFPPVSPHTYPDDTWSMIHRQKKRRKRRKGYAEYAVIPKQINKPSNLENINLKVQPKDNNLEENKLEEKKCDQHKKSEYLVSVPKEEKCFLKSSNDKDSFTKSLENKTKEKYVLLDHNKEILLFANNLVEKILQKAICKFIKTFESRKNNISKNSERNNKIVEEILENILNKIGSEQTSSLLTVKENNHVREINSKIETLNCCIKNKNNVYNNLINEPDLSKIILERQKVINQRLPNQKRESCIIDSKDSEDKEIIRNKETGIIMSNNKSDLKDNVPHVHKNVYANLRNDKISNTNVLTSETQDLCYKTISESSNSLENMEHNYQNATISDNNILKINNLNKLCEKQEDNSIDNKLINDTAIHQDFNNINDENSLQTFSECNELPENCSLNIHNLTSLTDENENRHDEGSSSFQYNLPSHSVSTEVLIRETEIELNKLRQLTLDSNQSIYKLAYDDQSETEDNDAKQVINKEPRCPKDCKNLQSDLYHSEIIIHEVDSASDAGSEDVELLPHRYESDTTKNCNKHVYVNNLSLAVELLRTRESLPYDHEFKRIVDDDSDNEIESKDIQSIISISGRLNPGFVEEIMSSSNDRHQNQNVNTAHTKSPQNSTIVQNEPERKIFKPSSADSGVQSEDSENEISDELKKTSAKLNKDIDSNNEDTRAKLSNSQARQRFKIYASRTNVMNPCFCCSIM